MKRKKKIIRDVQKETTALLEYLLAEAYARGQDMHYRLKVPYGPIKPNDKMEKAAELIVDISVYFDGDLNDERNTEQPTRFKITGPNKDRH